MSHQKVSLIPGDGIGPEVTEAVQKIMAAAGATIDWELCAAGAGAVDTHGTTLPDETVESIRKNRVALKGPIGTPVGGGFRSVNVELRRKLDLFANFRPTRNIPGLEGRYDNVDLIIVRENTEGLYSGIEHEVVPGVIESLRIITRKGSERIIRFAFELARSHGRKKVTAVHKANILKMSDGLFLEVAREIATDYPDIQYEESIVDATAMRLVINPSSYDVLVMENLFGDILSDLASGFTGGLGLAPSANIGNDMAVFEAVHGSAPDIAGKGLANPTALLLSGVLMLKHIQMSDAAARIENAVRNVCAEGKHLTGDLGGGANTAEYTEAIIRSL